MNQLQNLVFFFFFFGDKLRSISKLTNFVLYHRDREQENSNNLRIKLVSLFISLKLRKCGLYFTFLVIYYYLKDLGPRLRELPLANCCSSHGGQKVWTSCPSVMCYAWKNNQFGIYPSLDHVASIFSLWQQLYARKPY